MNQTICVRENYKPISKPQYWDLNGWYFMKISRRFVISINLRKHFPAWTKYIYILLAGQKKLKKIISLVQSKYFFHWNKMHGFEFSMATQCWVRTGTSAYIRMRKWKKTKWGKNKKWDMLFQFGGGAYTSVCLRCID